MWNPYVYQQQPQQNPAFAGYAYAAPQPAPVLNNFLTPEQIAEIQQNPQLFPTKLTRDEFLRSICTHKQNNMIKLDNLGDGNHHCTLCGEDFYLFDINTPEETVVGICKNMYDLIQSIKTYLLNAPEALKDIYMVLGFIKKFPILWKTAIKGFEQASNSTAFGLQSNPQMDAFQMLGNVFGGQMGGFYGQPMGYPQQAWQTGFQQPVAPPPAPQAPAAPAAAPAQPPVYTNNGYVIPNNPMMPQQPMPGYPLQTPVQQAYPAMGNPIGQVEPQVPGPVVAPPTAPAAATEAVNPNLQTPEKVDVNKAFTPAA